MTQAQKDSHPQQKPTATQQMLDSINAAIASGTAPWQKPWKAGEFLHPINGTTDKEYNGFNAVWLAMQGYNDPRWMTFKQANAQEFKIKKGEKANIVRFCVFTEKTPVVDDAGQPVLDENGNQQLTTVALTSPKVKVYSVFNATQIDGPEPFISTPPEWDPIDRVENLLLQATIEHGRRDSAFYAPSRNKIELPARNAFATAQEYYNTALHELSHLVRYMGKSEEEAQQIHKDYQTPKGKAREETTAEMTAMLLARDLYLDFTPQNNISYMASWAEMFKDEPFVLYKVASEAERRKAQILSYELTQEVNVAQYVNHSAEQSQELPELEQALYEVEVARKKKAEAYKELVAIGTHIAGLDAANFNDIYEDRVYGYVLRNPQFMNAEKRNDKLGSVFVEKIQQAKAIKEKLQQRVVTSESKTFLAVPYAEKNKAKKLGAQWDKEAKLWFVPIGADVTPFAKWQKNVEHEKANVTPALSPEYEFGDLIRSLGGDLRGPAILDGNVHRIPGISRPAGNKDVSYFGYADDLPNGWVQNFATGEKDKWIYTGVELSEEQKIALRHKALQQQELREKKRMAEYDKAAALVAEAYAERAPANSDHRYLVKKGIKAAEGVKISQDGKSLIVPIYNVSGEIRSLQLIAENGFKGYATGGEKTGNFFVVGCHHNEISSQPTLLLAEGYATAASLYEATGIPVVVAFDVNNMKAVGKNLRKITPETEIMVCCDNDHARKRPDGKFHNIGMDIGKQVADAVQGKLVIPKLTPDERGKGLTDFNDIHTSRGLGEVKKQITAALQKVRSKELVQ